MWNGWTLLLDNTAVCSVEQRWLSSDSRRSMHPIFLTLGPSISQPPAAGRPTNDRGKNNVGSEGTRSSGPSEVSLNGVIVYVCRGHAAGDSVNVGRQIWAPGQSARGTRVPHSRNLRLRMSHCMHEVLLWAAPSKTMHPSACQLQASKFMHRSLR